jgi:hypothetical protein
MNAALANLHPLPLALQRVDLSPFGRRHRIGSYEIGEEALYLFNQLLAKLDLRRAPISRDQLVTAARDLADQPVEGRVSPCIHERMRRAGAIDLMLSDEAWDPEDEVIAPAEMVVDYVRGSHDLIPDTLPRVGRLDDAIVVDTAWSTLAPEIRNYLDFCRLRQVEAGLGGNDRFGRREWELARTAEAEWIEHCRRVSGNTYLTDSPAHFRIC